MNVQSSDIIFSNSSDSNKFFVRLHGDKTYNSFVCGKKHHVNLLLHVNLLIFYLTSFDSYSNTLCNGGKFTFSSSGESLLNLYRLI